MKRLAPIVGIFDAHVPDHDPRLWASWLDWCRDEKPGEIIIGGDFLELESCSKHGGVARPALLREEVEAGQEALAEIRRVNPRARLTYLEGNHETRLTRKVVGDAPTLEGSISLPAMLELKKLGVSWHKYGDVVKRGKLGFTHGWWCNDHHAATHLRRAKCSLAYGHTHRPQMYIDGGADGSVLGAFGMPCMRKLDASWVNGAPTGWVQGFGVFYMHEGNAGLFSPYMVLAFEGAFVWGGKGYGPKKARRAA